MKPELDYIKKLLVDCQAFDKPTFNIEDLIIAGFDYHDKRFEFHVVILNEQGFIEQDGGYPDIGLDKSAVGTYDQWSVLPLRLTSSGHQFAEALSNKDVWATIDRKHPNIGIATLRAVALKLLADQVQKSIASEPQVSSKAGNTIFIGHGKSPIWRELKDLLVDRLSLTVDEFNNVATAGIPTAERLETMLNAVAFAFLVMTAEDEQADGRLRARENVVHEVGLFQGKLGFKKAIVLLEDECEEFSNIHGLGQIRFPRGDISAKFEDIRRVLERERIIGGNRARRRLI
jgi:predicted nucleotide-binding protein